jgi:hypothetical protein
MTRISRSVTLTVTLLAGCAGPPPASTPGSVAVVLSDAAAPSGYVEVAPISVTSGKGCGFVGSEGSREDAERLLRDKAATLHASFVRITEYRGPRPNHQCREREHVLSGIAYRAAVATVTPSSAAPVSPPPAAQPQRAAMTLLDYEGNAALGRPAAASATSSVALTLAAGDDSANALSVTYTCSGGDQRARLDVWNEARISDWHAASAVTFRVKPDAAISLSFSFIDGHGTGYTQTTGPLTPGAWQTVTLPLNQFSHNPFNPPGDHPGAPVDPTRISAFGFAPQGCQDGHFSIDDFRLAP